MTPPITLELRDPEAIIRGDGRDEPGMTRATLLRRAALGTGALIGGGLLVRNVPAAFGQASTDVDVLNLLYLNESLEVALYGAAARGGALSGAALTFARQLERNETVHRDLVRQALGSSARTLPPFDFGDVPRNQGKFLTTALALENGDVGAINGAGPLVSKKLLAVAAQAVSVEGRQAAWIRRIVYGPSYAAASQYPAPFAYDTPLTAAQVKAALAKTGFIKGQI